MKYKRYDKYKETGVEWLPEMPERWNFKKLKHVSSIVTGYAFSSDNFIEHGIPLLRIGDINRDGGVDLSSAKYLPIEYGANHQKHLVMSGDIVMAMTGATIGKVGVFSYDIPALLNQRVCMFRVIHRNHRGYLWYLLNSNLYTKYIDLTAFGGAQPNISDTDLLRFNTPLPSLNEQKEIADYLDGKTSKIDLLLQKLGRQKELLVEKRSALINKAVTRGLNPDAPMKKTGIEWLPEVPENWDFCSIKHKLNQITDGAHISPDMDNGIYPFISTVDITGGKLNFNDCLKTSKKSYDLLKSQGCNPVTGDVLFSKDGTIGKTAIIEEDKAFVVASSLIIMRPNKKLSETKFLDYLIQSPMVLEQINSFVKGVALKRLSLVNLKKIFMTFPLPSEQKQIAGYLDKQTAKIDLLQSKTNRQIELLKEYRSSLITSAVTGQIKITSSSN